MIAVRPSDQRGHANHGWLDSHHTFSFADYYDPKQMGFRALRVINEDRVDAGQGFGTHGHRDMEIVSYVLEGELAHRDNMGTGSTLRPGDVQRMTAGTGVMHSEFNASRSQGLHFLQIWVLPSRPGLEPSYEEKNFPEETRLNRLRPIVTPDGRDGTLRIQQDVTIAASLLEPGKSVEQPLRPGRHAWVQVARGSIELNGTRLSAGDGAQVSDEALLKISSVGADRAELLVFDLA